MYIESSYKQLLFGVSQQDYKDRLDGQVEAQVNMTSDLTFNIRRRAPLQFLEFVRTADPAEVLDVPTERLARYSTTVSNQRITVLVDTRDGRVLVYTGPGAPAFSMPPSVELTAQNKASIQFATLSDDVFIVNTERSPGKVRPANWATDYPDPTTKGFAFVQAGQFSKTYRLTFAMPDSSTEHSVSFTTPSGSGTGDAAAAAPEAIMTSLVTAAQAAPELSGFTFHQTGAYVYVEAPERLTLTTDSGSNFVIASNAMNLREIGQLPARLSPEADGLIVSVGTGRASTFYRWDADTSSWLEDAAREDIWVLQGVASNLHYSPATAVWSLDHNPEWERRASGDAESNPDPHFLESGITGLAVFQGRLVLLSNDYVNMSASNNPWRFYRSTVASLQSDDPIEVASTSSQASPYRHATIFNKDLILWADQYQGVVPGTQAVTPQNAAASVMTQYDSSVAVRPVVTGRSVYFASPRTQNFSAVWEATPSGVADSQLIGTDVTSHIPRYIPGPIRFMAGSTTTNILVLGYEGDEHTVVVHEYLWSGEEKVHHAWHKWTFAWPVLDAWFEGDRLRFVMRVDNRLAWCMLDLRVGAGETSATTGRLDLSYAFETDAGECIEVPGGLWRAWEAPWAFKETGEGRYMPQSLEHVQDLPGDLVRLRLLGSVEGDRFVVGDKYESYLTPTAPVMRDRDGVPITTQRMLLHKYVLEMRNTGEYWYELGDKYRPAERYYTSNLDFGAPELGAGIPLVAEGNRMIPARVDMPTSRLTIGTSDVYDLNITGLEYGFRYHQRYGRRL